LRTGRGSVGVIGIDSDEPGPLLTPVQTRLLDALCDQAALAIERVNLAQDIELARLAVETDRLRSALLTSISHDLRTPLASILGSASSLAMPAQTFDENLQRVLIGTILDESERLNRFIDNLLDMTRLESGPLRPNSSLNDLSDIIGTTLERAHKILDHHRVEIDLAKGLPMLDLDAVLMEQVLFNLLDNAGKYAPLGSSIQIRAHQSGDFVILQVLDEGYGIPETECERIFDKFYRIHRADRQRAGTGLGLSICRGFVEAMNGTIEAGNRVDRTGAAFTIKLPIPTAKALSLESLE
jgi:two-component system sensor histidine kinase KdpD